MSNIYEVKTVIDKDDSEIAELLGDGWRFMDSWVFGNYLYTRFYRVVSVVEDNDSEDIHEQLGYEYASGYDAGYDDAMRKARLVTGDGLEVRRD